jgi:hypothetical protein
MEEVLAPCQPFRILANMFFAPNEGLDAGFSVMLVKAGQTTRP